MTTVVYNSLPDKLRLYVERTIPVIFAAALEAREHRRYWAVSFIRPDQVHEDARARRYVDEDGNWDEVRAVALTERDGGDCEDWAAWLLCENWRRGHKARLVTSGDGVDPFQHAYVEVLDGGRWVASNPKGSQEGMEYGRHPDHPVIRRWALDGNGRVIEVDPQNATAVARPGLVRGSGADAGPGTLDALVTIRPDTPAVLNNQAWRTYVPALVRVEFWRKINDPSRQQAMEQQYLGTISRGELLQALPWAAPPNRAGEYPVRGYGDLFRGLTGDQQKMFWAALDGHVLTLPGRAAFVADVRARLKAGAYTETRESMLRFTRFAAINGGASAVVKTQVAKYRINLQPLPLAQVATLGQLNLQLVARALDEVIQPGETQAQQVKFVRDYAVSVGGNPAASIEQLAAVATAWISNLFTSQGLAFDEAVTVQEQLGAAAPEATRVAASRSMVGSAVTLAGAAGSAGVGDSFSRLVRHPLKWVRNVISEAGKGIQQFAQNILDADKHAPWLSTFLTKPLGFHLVAQVINQIGAVLTEGAVSAFDETQVARDAAMTLVASGQACLAAAPWTPLPYNVMLAAIGAASIAVGKVLDAEIDRTAEAREERERKAAGLPPLPTPGTRTVTVDEFGRELAEDGLPVDPFQRQLELDRRAREAAARARPDPATQTAGEWRKGDDGLWYGWHQFQPGWFWTAVQADAAGQAVAAWVLADTGAGPRWLGVQ